MVDFGCSRLGKFCVGSVDFEVGRRRFCCLDIGVAKDFGTVWWIGVQILVCELFGSYIFGQRQKGCRRQLVAII